MWWLISFDLRLTLDRLGRVLSLRGAGLNVRRVVIILILFFVVMHLAGVLVVVAARAAPIPLVYQRIILNLVVVTIWLVVLSVTIYFTTVLLFIRGDMDLLLSSPVPTRNVFTARAVSIALQGSALPIFVCLPAADVAAFFGDQRWLAAYPVTLALGLSAAAAGLLLTVLLVKLVGPRRARTLSLVLSAVFGASWFIVAETPIVLEATRMHVIYAGAGAWIKSAPLAGLDSVLWYPARAVQGDWVPLISMLLISLVFFVLVTTFLPHAFLFAIQRAADMTTPSKRQTTRHLRFHSNFSIVIFLKEWRLILRDPWLLSRFGRLLVILVVIALVFLRSFGRFTSGNDKYIPPAVAAGVTLVAGLVADMLVWLAISAEDLPDLLVSAPRGRFQLFRMKLIAMLAPIWVLALFGAAWLAWFSMLGAICLVVAVAGVTLSTGFMHLLNPVHASRTDLNRRMHSTEGIPLSRMVLSALILFGWSIAAFCFSSGHWPAGLIVVVAVAGVAGPVLVRGWNVTRRGELAER